MGVVTCSVEKGDFVVTDEVDRELVELEQQYGINLHRTWHTRLPRDLLVVWDVIVALRVVQV